MLLSPVPGFNFEVLPAYGNSWSVLRATFTSSTLTQKYLIYKAYVPRDELDSVTNSTISDLVLSLSSDTTISAHESLTVTHLLVNSNNFPAHSLLSIQFHLSAGCAFCEAGTH